MSINLEQLTTSIVRPILKEISLWTPAAEHLLLGTAAQETDLGYYLKQLGNGPGLGLYSMEERSHNDIWYNYLSYQPQFYNVICELIGIAPYPHAELLMYNIGYATIMCRLHYYRVAEALPDENDITKLAEYWKNYYNTNKGSGTVPQFIKNYKKYVGEYEF